MSRPAERLLELARPHRPQRLSRRELRVEALGAAAVLSFAVGMAVLVPSSRPLAPATVVLYAALYVLAAQVRLYVGAGYSLPTQLVLVPMLFALPVAVVPLVAVAGMAASAVLDVGLGRVHAERVVTAVGNGWHAVAPAAVLAAAGAPAAQLDRWPVFVLAFGAQCGVDAIAAIVREWVGRGIRPGLQLRVIVAVYTVDGLLAPVGLLVAVAAERQAVAALLVAPLLAVFGLFARDRRLRIEQATARLDELDRERARLQGTIRRVGEAFAANLDRSALVRLVVETAADALEAAHGRARVGDDVTPTEVQALGATSDLEQALTAAEQAALAGALPEPVARGTAWAIARALQVREDASALGTLAVARPGRPFSGAEHDLLGYLASQAAVSIQNARLHEELRQQATVDELTGLSNHRRLHQALDEEIARVRRFPGPLSLLMLDIDDFKVVNDRHGHLQGDTVLREVARAVKAHCRQVDEPARYGGEELAVMLPQTDAAGARAAGETIRRAVEALRIPLSSGGSVGVTASVGVATLTDPRHTKNDLIAAADAALYEAKRSGKNRTCVAAPDTAATARFARR